MGNQMNRTISTISDEVYDDLFIYKMFRNSTLLESLKLIEGPEVFTGLKKFCTNELEVCTVISKSLILIKSFLFNLNFKDDMINLQNEGNVYDMVELIVQNGACDNLIPGWSKQLLNSLMENNFNELSDAIRPSK